DIGFRRDAALQASSSQLQGVAVSLHGVIEQLLLRVGAAELEVVNRQLGMETEFDRLQVSSARLSLLAGRNDTASDAAPQIDLVGQLQRQSEIACGVGFRQRKVRLVG